MSGPAPPGAKRRRVLIWARGAALVACLGLFVFVLAKADLAAAWGRIRTLGPAAVLIFLPFPVALAFDTSAWRRLLGAIGQRASFWALFRVRLSTEALSNSAPAGPMWAEAMGPFLVSNRTGIPVEDAFAGLTAKRWLLIRTHGLYVATSAALGFGALGRASVEMIGNRALLGIVAAAAAVLVAMSLGIEKIAAHGKIAGRVSGSIGRSRFVRVRTWIEQRRHRFALADTQLTRLSDDSAATLKAMLLICGLWITEGIETFLILRLLGAKLGLLDVMSFDAALSILRSAAVFAPAGIGVQDAGYLVALDAYGVPDARAIGPAFVVLKRLKEAAWVAVGLILLARAPRTDAEIPQPPTAGGTKSGC